MERLWSPGVATGGNQRQIGWLSEPQKQANSVATACRQLRREEHGKQGVCRGLPPVAAGPLPAKEGVDADLGSRVGYFLRLQSGHGQCSQPQPVHASRITREILSPQRPVGRTEPTMPT
jgi:hypothetical protein